MINNRKKANEWKRREKIKQKAINQAFDKNAVLENKQLKGKING